uniref:Uncharacterized protein n=1 Tax=Aegilops tauschii subsp. strangulata TaxID=200361 RepID=A0A453HYT3_AEGTS
MGKTEPVRKMAQPCHRCPPATPVGHQRRRGAPSRSSRGGEEDTPPDSLFTLWSVYNLFQCSTRCPSQQNLTCRCEILLASLTICFGRSNSTQKGQMICDYFFPTISLGTASQQINGIVGSVAMYAEYPLTIQDWILVYTSHPLSCSEIYNEICSGDDSGSSESLPQPNNRAYKPTFINIGNDAGPSHRRMKAKKKKEHTLHGAPGTIYFLSFDSHCIWGNK